MIFVATLVGTLLIAFGLQAAERTHTYKDWAVACDNTRHCEAVGYQNSETDPAVALWLARDAGPGATFQARLTARREDESDVGALTIQVGQARVTDIPPEQDLKPPQVATLLPALIEGTTAAVSDSRSRWTLSLAGLKAALLYMDDQQGRVGTQGAMVRKGPKSDATVPKGLLPPVVTVAKPPSGPRDDDKLLQAVLAAVPSRDCWEDLPDSENPFTELNWLSADQVLVQRECLRGAYQGSSKLWIASATAPHSPQALQLSTESGESDDLITEAGFGDGILNSYAKARGVGDCGISRSWAWTGSKFVLIEASEAPLCRGLGAGGFPLRTWTATVVH